MDANADELNQLTKEELFDIAMVLYNIQCIRTKYPQNKVFNLPADLHNFRNEYFQANYVGHEYYDEEDGETVYYAYTELRNQELDALRRLTNNGALRGINIKYRKTEDPAGLGVEYDESACYQLVLDSDKFEAYHRQVMEAAQARILVSANLSFIGVGTPMVAVDTQLYKLSTMRDGNAFEIIDHCLRECPGQEVSLTSLAGSLKLSGVSNINEALKNSLFDRKNGVLRHFVSSSPKAITVNETILLPKPQLENIILASKK